MKQMITGDRMASAYYPALVAIEMMKALAKGDTIVTGDNAGVEQLVRDMAEAAELEVEVIPTVALESGKPDWDLRHQSVVAVDYAVVAIHAEPHESSIIKSLSAIMPDDKLRIVTPMDLMV